jgi:vacuolar-type H+-ATPase subunit B/Vma2
MTDRDVSKTLKLAWELLESIPAELLKRIPQEMIDVYHGANRME